MRPAPNGRRESDGHKPPLVELRLTALARPPAPAELEAIVTAVEVSLGLGTGAPPPGAAVWRFSGRWWQRRGRWAGP